MRMGEQTAAPCGASAIREALVAIFRRKTTTSAGLGFAVGLDLRALRPSVNPLPRSVHIAATERAQHYRPAFLGPVDTPFQTRSSARFNGFSSPPRLRCQSPPVIFPSPIPPQTQHPRSNRVRQNSQERPPGDQQKNNYTALCLQSLTPPHPRPASQETEPRLLQCEQKIGTDQIT